MLKQFMAIKEQHPDKLILFRMGDFYETFFDDAKVAARVLGITLTARNKKADNPVPLAGFPYHALDNYLNKLIKKGLKVVICEQMEDPRKAKGLVKRGIIDIITPGTIIDSDLIGKDDNNFLCAVFHSAENKIYGFSAIDASTADFLVTELDRDQLISEVMRLHPSELIFTSESEKKRFQEINLDYEPALTVFDTWYSEQREAEQMLKNHFQITSLEGIGLEHKPLAQIAAATALAYLKSLKNEELKHISNIKYYSLSCFLQIDEVTRRNLELFRSIRYNTRQGSLISVIDQTRTPLGARELIQWLSHPLMDIQTIYNRSEAVHCLKENYALTRDIRELLKNVGDLSRLLSKVGTRKINPRDVIALKNYLSLSPRLGELISEISNQLIQKYKDQIKDYSDIIHQIENTIMADPPVQITEGNIIRDSCNEMLDELRNISRNGKSWIARMEDYERQKTGIPSLKVNYNKIFGYYIEVTKTHKDKIPEHYIRKQTLVNAERYISPELKEYEVKVLGAEERIKNLEYELFLELREKLYANLTAMQELVSVIANLDVLCNLAHIAYHNNYRQPFFNTDGIVDIKNCRHPVIESLLDTEEFIPNDVYLNNADTRIALITGPNMAGKSTYLRQLGLIVLLAQMGSFVPAESASLPIFDKIFTRVGASDNLALGQSTFLVEMLETANILNSATPRSLVLLDEIGRGTSTFDGLSLAWAIVEYIHNKVDISAKTLFATHYHELTELENVLPGVKNYNILVKEWDDKVIFLRKIERGAADQSYGIQVARLAGIPAGVIKRAKQILHNLEEHEISPQGLSAQAKKQLARENFQMDIFDSIFAEVEAKEEILQEIRKLDLDNLTPLEALRKLVELKEKMER
ncbi:MAG: DNA mismatch repair protein MutS [Candidatus Cloacimonetes bacterium]|nr:DNA mismatch repair protein MutS [Candidatus Cloacimonadota bacterium]